MTEKKSNKRMAIIMFFVVAIFAIAIPTVCIFIPYRNPIMKEDFDIVEDSGRWVAKGTIENPSIVKINTLKFDVFFEDASGNITIEKVVAEVGVKGGKTKVFSHQLNTLPLSGKMPIGADNFYFEYTMLSPYYLYIIGICACGLVLMLFMRKKYYLTIGSHKIIVLAGLKKAAIVIDGKLYKEMVAAGKFQTLNAKYKIAEKMLTVDFKMGSMFPDVTIKVDGVDPEFDKIKQHSFLSVKKDITSIDPTKVK